jgi:hypothetical protein
MRVGRGSRRWAADRRSAYGGFSTESTTREWGRADCGTVAVMTSAFLYFAGDRLSLAELSAARLDGHVVELGDAYIPADAVETRELRAGSLRELLGDALAATHLSAAWVHGARHEPPPRHTVQRAVSRRLHHVMGQRLLYRDLTIDPDDLLLIGGVWVTTPLRTLADLARVDDAEHRRAARQLAAMQTGSAVAAIRWLEEHGALPYKRSALRLLTTLVDADQVPPGRDVQNQEDVTR